MKEVESLHMEQTEEVVTPQETEEAEGAQGRAPAGEQGTEAAEPSGQQTQSPEDNHRYQAARKSGEQAGYDRAMREVNRRIAKAGMRNPGSGEIIRDIDGLEGYGSAVRKQRIQEKAQREGRSEAEVEEEEANREFLSASRRAAEEREQEDRKEAEAKAWIAQDVRDFMNQYPGVDLGKLDGNPAFRRFCGSRYGREPLAGLYADYLELAGGAAQAAAAKAESKAERATGTGGGSGAEALTASQQRQLDEWNRENPDMKMTAKEFLRWK